MIRIALVVIVISCVFPEFCRGQQETTPVSTDAFWPQATRLPGGELSPLLEEWDNYVASDDLTSKSRAVMVVAQYVERTYVYHGERVLRYNNPEIKDRVVALYLRECGKRQDPNLEGGSRTNPWNGGELGYDYMVALMTLAECTFDPRIWDLELVPPVMALGNCRLLYLATVDPQKTLEFLLESRCGVRIGAERPGHPDCFYHGATAYEMSVDNAYTLLSLMCKQSPKVVQDQRERVLAFVRKHLPHYASPRPRGEPVYSKWPDYDVRNAALDVLALLGKKEDIETVQDITRGAPVVDLKRANSRTRIAREQVEEKGTRVMQLIRYR